MAGHPRVPGSGDVRQRVGQADQGEFRGEVIREDREVLLAGDQTASIHFDAKEALIQAG